MILLQQKWLRLEPLNKIWEERKEITMQCKKKEKRLVIDHIQQFLTVESHYVRRDANWQYLPEVTIKEMHRMYKKWCTERGYEKQENYEFYQRTFKTWFNLSFTNQKRCLWFVFQFWQYTRRNQEWWTKTRLSKSSDGERACESINVLWKNKEKKQTI